LDYHPHLGFLHWHPKIWVFKLKTFLAVLFLVEFTFKAALDLLSHATQEVKLTKLFVLDEK
jgi:hypothetical protein